MKCTPYIICYDEYKNEFIILTCLAFNENMINWFDELVKSFEVFVKLVTFVHFLHKFADMQISFNKVANLWKLMGFKKNS